MSRKLCAAGKGDVASRVTSQLPSHKAKEESLHLQGNPQSQLCVINLLKHMVDRSMEIRNIKLLVQDTGKFQIPDEQ